MRKPNLEYYSLSYQGRRKKNEDVAFLKVNSKFDVMQVTMGVADGMGGYEKGHIASHMAALEIEKLTQHHIPLNPQRAKNMLLDSIKGCNDTIYTKSQQLKDTTMGTTITGAVFKGNRYLVFNVGDSRTYKVTSKGIFQITEDHSADVEAFKDGMISKDEVGKGFYAHALLKSLGTDPTIEPDIFPMKEYRDTFYELQPGEAIFSCTDGLWGVLTDEELFTEIIGRNSLKESFESLAALAYLKGSTDNISISGIEYGQLKRKNLDLKKYPPPNKLMKNQGRKKNVWLLIILILSFLGFLITSYIIYHMIKNN